MRKFVQQKLKEQKGLTLIELLAVIVILAIIVAIAIPAIGNIIQNSRVEAAKSDALNVLSAANLYETENGTFPAGFDVDDLINDGFLEDAGDIPVASTITAGPTLQATIPDVIGTVDMQFNGVTQSDINNHATNTGGIREAMEAANAATYVFGPL